MTLIPPTNQSSFWSVPWSKRPEDASWVQQPVLRGGVPCSIDGWRFWSFDPSNGMGDHNNKNCDDDDDDDIEPMVRSDTGIGARRYQNGWSKIYII